MTRELWNNTEVAVPAYTCMCVLRGVALVKQ